MLQRCVYVCIIIIYIYGRVRELKSLFYHFRFFPLVFFFFFFFFIMYIYIIYIYSFIYNISRRLLPTVPSVVISLRFPWSFNVVIELQARIIEKSSVQVHFVLDFIYPLYIYHSFLSFHSSLPNTSVRANLPTNACSPSLLFSKYRHNITRYYWRERYTLFHILAIILTKMTRNGVPRGKMVAIVRSTGTRSVEAARPDKTLWLNFIRRRLISPAYTPFHPSFPSRSFSLLIHYAINPIQ